MLFADPDQGGGLFHVRGKLKDIAASVGFAYLQTISFWSEIVSPSAPQAYFATDLTWTAYGATLFVFTIVAATFFVALAAYRRFAATKAVGKIALVLLVVSLVNPLTLNGYILYERQWLLSITSFFDKAVLAYGLVVISLIAMGVVLWSGKATKICLKGLYGAFIVALPMGGVVIVPALAQFPEDGLAKRTEQLGPMNGQSEGPRVVLAIFDELDYEAVFETSALKNLMPNLRKLVSKSLFGKEVWEAGSNTIDSIPALTTGESGRQADPVGVSELVLSKQGRTENWKETSNIFSALKARGKGIGLVGWYHPYCRVFKNELSNCSNVFLGSANWRSGMSFMEEVEGRLAALNPMRKRANVIEAVRYQFERTEFLIKQTDLDFLYLHIPLPHLPAVYDRKKGGSSKWNFRLDGYIDNLAAVDDLIGRLLSALQASAGGRETWLVLTADHAWRGAPIVLGRERGHKVPLVITRLGDDLAGEISERVAATKIRGMIEGLVEGRIGTSDHIKAVLVGD